MFIVLEKPTGRGREWRGRRIYNTISGSPGIHFRELKRRVGIAYAALQYYLEFLEKHNLIEHTSFTDLLRPVFHLTEELDNREDLSQLPDSDLNYLANDIHRVYGLLVTEWLSYMQYLKNNYPYLFSLAMRTNPFDQKSSAIIIE